MAGNAPAYRIRIGSQSLSDKSSDNERLLLKAEVRLSMDGYGNRCEIVLGDAENAAPKPQDAVSVELDNGGGMKKVFTGAVDAVTTHAAEQRVVAFDALNRLNNVYIESSYEKINAGYVVKDLLSQGGVSPGTIESGFDLSAWALHSKTSALAHIRQFAQWCGADVYSDGDGKAHFTLAKNTGAAHSFQYGGDIYELALQASPPLYDSIEIIGEGAAGSQGADKFYWLAKDVSGVIGKASIDLRTGKIDGGKLGKKPRRLVLGAVRTQDAAKQVAENYLQALASRWLQGRMRIFGAPAVRLADSIDIDGLPGEHSASALLQDGHKLRVRGICHTLDLRHGLTTQLEF